MTLYTGFDLYTDFIRIYIGHNIQKFATQIAEEQWQALSNRERKKWNEWAKKGSVIWKIEQKRNTLRVEEEQFIFNRIEKDEWNTSFKSPC